MKPIVLALLTGACLGAAEPITVTFDTPGTMVGAPAFAGQGPGANGIVQSITDDVVTLACDQRGATGAQNDHNPAWFWFYARVHPQGRTSFKLAIAHPVALGVTASGVAISTDEGKTWGWNGSPGTVNTIAVPPGASSVLVALAPPYTDQQWQDFVRRLGANAPRLSTLCTSNRGRPVPLAEFGPAHGAKRRILLTARTHACEVSGSLVLEGFLETVATDPQWKKALSDVLVQAIPFVDRDGVELGEQGKNRTPHDHNRDFGSTRRIYAETRALIALAQDAAQPTPAFAYDLHAPWISGGANEMAFAYVPGDEPVRLKQRYEPFLDAFAALNRTASWPTLVFRTSENDPTDQPGPDNPVSDPIYNSTFMRERLTPQPIAITFETPFGRNHGQEVTWPQTRGFGRSLAMATLAKLQTPP